MGLPTPIEREEMYLSNIAGQGTPLPDAPISREEMYLDYIAKNGGGGGTGEGDMKKSVYDSDLDVATAGGIKSYVSGAISDKVDKVSGKGLSTNDYDNTAKGIVDGVTSELGNKADASTVNAILDGQSIDSFGDVETALASKTNLTVVAPAYNSSASYEDDDLVTNAGVLQRYDGVSEPWVTTTVAEELKYKQPLTGFDQGDFSVIGTMGDGHSTRSVSLNKDSAPTANSTKPVESGGVYTALAGIKDGQSIDSFGDVETALADKVDKVAGKGLSTNDYDDTEKAKVAGAFPRSEQAVLGAKNYLPNNAVSGSDNNTTWVVNADKSVTVNTGTGGASANVVVDVMRPITIKKGSYKLSGCPSGGSYGTYYIQLRKADGTQYDIRDTGSGYDLTLSEDTTFTYCAIVLLNGTEANNLVFKPMVRLASDPDDTYVPYAMTNRELTEKVAVKSSSATVNPGITVATNNVTVQGNVVDLFLHISDITLSASDDTVVGTVPYLPVDSVAFFDVIEAADPFNQIACGFVRSNGQLVIKHNSSIASKTAIYIKGMYICK